MRTSHVLLIPGNIKRTGRIHMVIKYNRKIVKNELQLSEPGIPDIFSKTSIRTPLYRHTTCDRNSNNFSVLVFTAKSYCGMTASSL